MNCIAIQKLLSAYIDGECSNNEKRIIEEHLEQCSDCLEEYKILKTIVGDLGNIEEIDLPDGFHNDLMDKIKSSTPMVKNMKGRSIKRWYSATAAAFLFIIIFGVIGTATLTRWTNYSKDEMMYEASEESQTEESSDSGFDDSAPMVTSIEPGNDMFSLELSTTEDIEEEIDMDESESSEKEEFATPSSDSAYTASIENKNLADSGDSIDEQKINDIVKDTEVVKRTTLTMNEDEELEDRTSNHRLPMKNFVVIIVIVLIVISIPILIIIYSVNKRTKK